MTRTQFADFWICTEYLLPGIDNLQLYIKTLQKLEIID